MRVSIGIESMEHLPQVVKGGWRGLGAKKKEEFISWQQGNKVVVPQLTDACMHGIGSGPAWWRACTGTAPRSPKNLSHPEQGCAVPTLKPWDGGVLGAQAKGGWLLRRGFASCERKWPPRYNTRAPA